LLLMKNPTAQRKPNDTPPLVYSVVEAARLLGLGRNAAYAAVARGDIPTIRIGRRKLVPKAPLHRILGITAPATELPTIILDAGAKRLAGSTISVNAPSPVSALSAVAAGGSVGPSSTQGTTGVGEPSKSDEALDAGIKALGNPLPAAGPAVAGFRRRGRRPIKLEQTKEKMRRDILEGRQKAASLNDMLEKNLASTYGVSREIARKARNAVLSEFGENSNPDK